MGCNIHCYIEYKDRAVWHPFGSRINPGRNYEMFDILAGVRSPQVSRNLIEPRGWPEDIAFEAKDDLTLFITDTSKDDRYVTTATAEQWVAKGISTRIKDCWVTHPDWHSHSWLTTIELEQCVKLHTGEFGWRIEYEAILAAMRCFEANGRPARLVFWFDN